MTGEKEKQVCAELEDVSFSYGSGEQALQNVSFRLEEGERVGLIGANGAGKSTLMKCMLGLLPHEGSLRVFGLEVETKNLKEVRRRLGFVLQSSDNQMFMPRVWDDLLFGPLNYGLSREEAERAAMDALRELGIEDLKGRYNHRISGGEKRMAAIAAVLAMGPDALILDEPSASLDPYNRRAVIRTLQRMDRTMLIASHDLDMILETCSRVLVLSGGRLAADGPAEEILSDRALLEAHRLELPFCLAGMCSKRQGFKEGTSKEQGKL